MQRLLILFAVLCLGPGLSAASDETLELEAGWVFPGYIDVAVPGDTGTRLSLDDDLDADETVAVRLRYGRRVGERHWWGVLVAPLTVESEGTLDKDVDFDGRSFRAGEEVDATFRFDSYRLLYRYLVKRTETLSAEFGAALKVRDAVIRLESDTQRAAKPDTGFVPLLSFNVTWSPTERLDLLVDGEALAAPQGRAEDVLLAARYALADDRSVYAAYRVLEGGADNDTVYTFSLFHYAVLGASWVF